MRLLDVSAEVSTHLKYRPGLIKWRVYHKSKGRSNPAAWYYNYESVPEVRRVALRKTMFNSIYTEHNNNSPPSAQMDPLQLKNCLRLYPHDDNQGGFFVAVFEKLVADDSGIIEDDGMTQDAWNNPNVR